MGIIKNPGGFMSEAGLQTESTATSRQWILENLQRLDAVIRGPYVRQADIETRDRFARRLRDLGGAAES